MDTFRNNLIYQFLGEYVTAHRNRSMKWIVRVIRCQLRLIDHSPTIGIMSDFILFDLMFVKSSTPPKESRYCLVPSLCNVQTLLNLNTLSRESRMVTSGGKRWIRGER